MRLGQHESESPPARRESTAGNGRPFVPVEDERTRTPDGDGPRVAGPRLGDHVASKPPRDATRTARRALRREVDFEREVLPALLSPLPHRGLASTWAGFGRSADGPAMRAARVTAIVLLGLYLTWSPLLGLGVGATTAWTVYVASIAIGAVCLLGLPRRGALPLAVFTLFWATWAATRPAWSAWWPTGHMVAREGSGMLAAALTSLGLCYIARTNRSGVAAIRLMWLAILLTLVPMAIWEVVSGQHFRPDGVYEPPPWSPSAIFPNPNNLAVVLVVGVGVVLVWMTERVRPWVRVAFGVLALVTVGLIALTLSRLALLAVGVILLTSAALAWQRHGHPGPSAWIARHQLLAGSMALAAVSGFVASFVVPSLIRHNPILRMLFPGDESTVRADNLRAELARIALQHWSDDPWWGIGAGRFEVLLRRLHPEVGRVTPLHNGFIELLTEYGLILFVPFVILLTVLTWRTVNRGRRRPARPAGTSGLPSRVDATAARHLTLTYLVGVGLAGVVTSSPLQWFPWWMLLASATATAGWLGSRD